MKAIREYTLSDWRRLRPIGHALKTLRYRAVDRAYVRLPARSRDLQAVQRAIRGRRVVTTIAFADPQAIDWQSRLLQRYLPNATYVIADNSPDDDSARAIQSIAARDGVLYVRLPKNPWAPPSRSHGASLNWVWRNVILKGEPDAFGFLDDDLFPTSRDDPFAPLAAQDCYGMVRTAGDRWFLWAGFCFYRFASVRRRRLDFGQDWFNGLDSGGRNWTALYRHLDLTSLQRPSSQFLAYRAGIQVEDGPIQWVGTWLHEVGLMGLPEHSTEKRRVVAAMLADHFNTS